MAFLTVAKLIEALQNARDYDPDASIQIGESTKSSGDAVLGVEVDEEGQLVIITGDETEGDEDAEVEEEETEAEEGAATEGEAADTEAPVEGGEAEGENRRGQ